MRLVLASGSPARLATLHAAGLRPEVVVSGVDEDGVTAESTSELVCALARLKASAVAARLAADGRAGSLVLGCDSLLEVGAGAECARLGKPGSVASARRWWQAMRGSAGTLHTGHCLIDTVNGRHLVRGAAATVRFAMVSDADIDAYCATGEPVDVAGAFTIDGLGGWFIDGVDGDPHTVTGLSLPLLRTMLGELGHSLTDLGYPAAD